MEKELLDELMDSLLCPRTDLSCRNVPCMLNICKTCARTSSGEDSPHSSFKEAFMALGEVAIFENNTNDAIKYSCWKQSNKQAIIETLVKTVDEFLAELYEQFCVLIPHHYVAKTQGQFFKLSRNPVNLINDEAIIQVDFAENFTFIVQHEVQSFHWNKLQATIHPFVIWLKVDSEVKSISLAAISNDLKHGTETFFAFQNEVLQWLKKSYPHIKLVKYFSDGCAGQYKNFKNFRNIACHYEDFKLHAEWHYFAMSHGKGAVDGVSAVIKNSARRHSLRCAATDQILSAEALFNHCKEKLQNVVAFYVTADQI